MENNHGPCIEKNCSFCCDPVKIPSRNLTLGNKLPKKKDGSELWIRRSEILVPEDDLESKIVTFDCVNFDKTTGRCLDYDGRPNECRNTSCLNIEGGTDDEKHKELTEKKFIKINPIGFK